MKEYIERENAEKVFSNARKHMKPENYTGQEFFIRDNILLNAEQIVHAIPAADVVEEENILKFYYVRSIDEYWIGQRIDNFYYAEYDPKRRQWVWTHSRHLPWGEHIVSPTSLWKEHTYPSEPEEMPFPEWLQGFIKKHAADVEEVRHGRWEERIVDDPLDPYGFFKRRWYCSSCGRYQTYGTTAFCPKCGAKMTEVLTASKSTRLKTEV